MLRPASDIRDDPRFLQGIELFNAGDFDEAGDLFEDLFFEAVMWEVEFTRLLLQLSVGMLHAQRHQWRAAGERLGEGLKALDRLDKERGLPPPLLRAEIVSAIESTRRESVPALQLTLTSRTG